jgi:hypothetical protein
VATEGPLRDGIFATQMSELIKVPGLSMLKSPILVTYGGYDW